MPNSDTNIIELLRRDKYDGDKNVDVTEDLERLAAGEPLAYVIGWVPFLGLKIDLATKPLIPRPETEWWTELLIKHLKEKFCTRPFRLLDMCAGSGAIGLSILHAFPSAAVVFTELYPEHIEQIQTNIRINDLDVSRTEVRESNVFDAFYNHEHYFNVIVSNPPYIPSDRTLPESVISHEPKEALYAGEDGLSIIRRIAEKASGYVYPKGEVWMECDTSNIKSASELLKVHGAEEVQIIIDLYGRERLLIARYS